MIMTSFLEFETRIGDIVDLTQRLSSEVYGSGMHSGIITVFVTGATGAVTTIEYESGLIEDMANALERLAPEGIDYAHDLRWHDGNGHSHIRASMIGPSMTVPFHQGRLMLGTWQQIVFLEMDNRPRHRKVVVQIMGE